MTRRMIRRTTPRTINAPPSYWMGLTTGLALAVILAFSWGLI